MNSPLRLVIAFSLCCAPLNAQTVGASTTQPAKPALVLSEKTMISIAQNPQMFVETAIKSLFRATSSGILTKEVLVTLRKMQAAQMRSKLVSDVLTFDLDGSFSVEAAEIEAQVPHLDTRRRIQLETYMATADLDRDGTLSTEEIRKFSISAMSARSIRNQRGHIVDELMQFDANGDGQVTPAEIGEVVAGIVARGTLTRP